jgi:cytochrome P450
MDLFLVARYSDVKDAASRKEDFSSNLTALIMATADDTEVVGAELVQMEAGIEAVDVLATADPPDHTRQRRTVARTFREIEQSEGTMRAVIQEMLAPMIAGNSCDLMEDFALWVPVRVIGDVLGLPETDAALIRHGAECGVELLSGVRHQTGSPRASPASWSSPPTSRSTSPMARGEHPAGSSRSSRRLSTTARSPDPKPLRWRSNW